MTSISTARESHPNPSLSLATEMTEIWIHLVSTQVSRRRVASGSLSTRVEIVGGESEGQ